ncbi:acyl-[acyl-carrier-protein] thioesterase [Flavobacterium sp. CYK-4]|uniref:acyl-[acyl-carrier-protein] thioesterase n=1 Tax=Flavobacterium lotistagni TaxID=2709660 RepID=UPI0014090FDC|nr:acyl-ACP thioesterase domain-containing protein [Flavobacterium lotistagni]NHM06961.1 acyl-[acyl-carrier-protein] thioesterase [Flavobacterium lotistagni]
MPIAPDFQSVFSRDWEINFMQCTPNGFLRYTELCNLLQLTAAAHSESGGFSFVDMQAFDQAWVLSRMRLEISKLPKWKDVITIKTWINSLENSRSVRAMEVTVNGEKYVGAETFWAVFNTKTRRPEGMALAHEHCEKYPDERATLLPFSKIDIDRNNELVFERKVVLSDLDIVNHVNNVKYLEWCLDLVDDNEILNQRISSFEMNFLKELSLNDWVQIHTIKKDNKTVFSITKDDKAVFALELETNY